MLKQYLMAACVALGAAFAGAASAQQSTQPSPTLDAIRSRGAVVCGISTGVAGFALPDSQGN